MRMLFWIPKPSRQLENPLPVHRSKSLFTYDFGDLCSTDAVDFNTMFRAARDASGASFVKVWAHNVSDIAVRSSVFQRVVVPRPRKVVQMQLTLEEDSGSTPAEFCGHSLRPADVQPQSFALLRPAWRVVLEKREVRPTPTASPLSWVTGARVGIDPAQCVRITTSLT